MDPLLVDVLGLDGARAVERAVADRPSLAGGVRPRAALAWATTAVRLGFSGPVPGCPDVTILVKGEDWSADDLSGSGAPSLAAVLVALSGGPIGKIPRGKVMMRLGKNLDLLAEATWQKKNPVQELRRKATLKKSSSRNEPGPKAAPVAPTPPEPPQAPTPPTKGAQAKVVAPKAPAASLWRSEALLGCSVCGQAQFREGELSGCACWGDLLAKTEVLITPLGFMLMFQPDDREDSVAFLQEVRRGR